MSGYNLYEFNNNESKPTLVLDFDGVLHSYCSGWCGATDIRDDPVDGAKEFCQSAMEWFRVVIVSTRCTKEGGWEAIVRWLGKWNFPSGIYVSTDGKKVPATVSIDDRVVQFDGTWPEVDSLKKFMPWNKIGRPE